MPFPDQLGTLRGELDELQAEVLDTKEALAAAKAPADVAFWRQQLRNLNKKQITLQKQDTIAPRGQPSGEHCLPRYLLPPLG